MSHDRKIDTKHDIADPILHDGNGHERIAGDPEATWQSLVAFVDEGKGSAHEIPYLMRGLSLDQRRQAFDLLPKLAKRIGGDALLECCAVIGFAVDFALETSFQDAKPPATDIGVRRYLRSLSPEEIVTLDRNDKIIARVGKVLPGPLGVELPQLADLPAVIQSLPNMIHWFVVSTDPPSLRSRSRPLDLLSSQQRSMLEICGAGSTISTSERILDRAWRCTRRTPRTYPRNRSSTRCSKDLRTTPTTRRSKPNG